MDWASRLLEHGPAGLAALVVIVVVGFVYRMMRMQADSYLKATEALTKAIDNGRELFTEEAAANREVVSEIAASHRIERRELAVERGEMADRLERVANQGAEVAASVKDALGRVCSRMEERPCLMGARLANSGEDQPRGGSEPPEGD